MALDVLLNPRDTRGFVKLGKNHRYEVVPESIKFSGDFSEYGCLNCAFLLKMNPLYPHYDIEQFTPVVIKDGPVEVWSGRVISTPSEYGESGVIYVECHGWGQHLKDNCTDYEWVVSDLTRFKDMRSVPGAVLGSSALHASAQIEVGEKLITLMNPSNVAILSASAISGVSLDLGPNNRCTKIIAEYESSNNAVNTLLGLSCGTKEAVNDPLNSGAGGGVTVANNAGASGLLIQNIVTKENARVIFLWLLNGVYTPGADVWFRIKSVQIFMETSFESGNTSILKSSTIIKSCLNLICPNISNNHNNIAETSFNIPAFPNENGISYKYANELIDKANAFHNWKFLLTPQATAVPVYEPLDTLPFFAVGESDDYKFSDPSRNDGRSIYNRIISEYEDAAGNKAYAEITDSNYNISPTYQFSNPGFETNFTGWTSVVGTVVRSTTTGHNGSVASACFTSDGVGGATMANSGGAQVVAKNQKHAIGFYMRREVALTSAVCRITDGTNNNILAEYNFTALANGTALGAWFEVPKIGFIGPPSGLIAITVILGYAGASTIIAYADNFTIYDVINSLISRRGFTRTALRPIGMKTTQAAAGTIAQLEYNNSQFPPLKGKLEMKGRIRKIDGSTMPVSHIPGWGIGRIILLEQLRDPNTGAFGRMATIRAAEYQEDTDTVTIDLDNEKNFIANLKNRIL